MSYSCLKRYKCAVSYVAGNSICSFSARLFLFRSTQAEAIETAVDPMQYQMRRELTISTNEIFILNLIILDKMWIMGWGLI